MEESQTEVNSYHRGERLALRMDNFSFINYLLRTAPLVLFVLLIITSLKFTLNKLINWCSKKSEQENKENAKLTRDYMW